MLVCKHLFCENERIDDSSLFQVQNCNPHLPRAMDPQSARALACTATGPLGEAGQLIIDNYLEGHRSRSLLDTDPEAPNNRCIFKVGRGRCRKRVSSVALVQHCAKHQRHCSICYPGDIMLAHWNARNLFQKE